MQLTDGDSSNFTQLQNDIDSGVDTVELDGDYSCEDGFKSSGVNISRDMTVKGHDVTINAKNKSAIFNITADKAAFSGIDFVDSPNAVVSSSDSLIFENCRFINAGVTFVGGNLTFKNCEFIQNSFIDANAENVNIEGSKFHDLRIFENGISINASNVVIAESAFEDNVAYKLSGDTLYTGGFANLINVSASEMTISNSRFRANSVGTMIYSNNSTTIVLDAVKIEDTDFRALEMRNGIKKNIGGNGFILAGNVTNLYLLNSNLTDIQGCMNTSLIGLNLTGDFIAENSRFENINFPYGIMELYDSASNPVRGEVTFKDCSFKNLKSECNLTYYGWDSQKGEYIWDYVYGGAMGFKIDVDIYNYDKYVNKDLTFANVNFDDIEGGGYLIHFSVANLNVTNFTIANSKIARTEINNGGDYSPYGCVLNGRANGTATIRDVVQNNVTRCEYSQISYNSTCSKYLYRFYAKSVGGAGFLVFSTGDMDVYNYTVTDCIGSDQGIMIFDAEGNLTADKILIDNVSGSALVESDRYYPEKDLQTFLYLYDSNWLAGFGKLTSMGNTNVSNLVVKNSSLASPYSWWGRNSEALFVEGTRVNVENMTFSDFTLEQGSYAVSVYGEDVTFNHFSMDGAKSMQIDNKTFYDETLGEYMVEYECSSESPVVYIQGGNATVKDMNITNCEMGFDNLLRFSSENIIADSIVIKNITSPTKVKMDYDRDLGQYVYENSTACGSYEGVLSIDNAVHADISNVFVSDVVATGMGNVFYFSSAYGQDPYVNLVNVTVLDAHIPDMLTTKFDKALGRYITTRDAFDCDGAFAFDTSDSAVILVNFTAENMNGFGKIFKFNGGESVEIINSTFSNMSSYLWETEFDRQRNKTVIYREDNTGQFMDAQVSNILIAGSTFSNMNFSSQDGQSGMFYIYASNSTFSDDRLINCTLNPGCQRDYDSSTGDYMVDISDESGAVIELVGYSNNTFANMKFENSTAIRGGAIYIYGYDSISNIVNCSFASNNAKYGGAIYIDSGNVNIIDSGFSNNSANVSGGAIYLGENAFNVTVRNSNFTNNSAEYDGGALYIMANNIDMNLIDSSMFAANHAGHNGGAFLFNDTFNQDLFVDYRWFYRTVMFDDNVELKKYNAQILNSKFENNTDYALKIIAGGLKPSQNQTVTVEIAPDAVGQIEVNITDSEGNFLINGNYTLTNGSYTFNLGILGEGSYNISVRYDNYSFDDTNLYLFHINSTAFGVAKFNMTANVTARNVTTLENATFDIAVPDGFKGYVNITVDGETYLRNVSSIVEIAKLLSGNKTANVTFWGDSDYKELSMTVNFTVSQVGLNADVKIDNVTTVENVTVEIGGVPAGFSGNVSVVVDNVTVYDGPVNSTIDLGRFLSGNKTANVTFYGDDIYSDESHEVNFTVSKVDFNADVKIDNVTTVENVTVEIGGVPAGFSGNVSVVVDNVTVYDGPVNSTVDIGRFLSGNKTANVTFYGDSVYDDKTVEANFTVSKADLDVNVTADNVTTLENATLTIDVPAGYGGNVSVVIDNVTVYDGQVNSTIDIGRIASGNKTANVTFYGDEIYADKTVETNFTVSKVDLNVNATVGNVSAVQNATVNITGVPDDYKGNVSITVDNVTVYDGPANSTIDIGRFDAGNKTATVTFYGDERFENKSVETSFSVSSTISAADIKRGWMSPYDFTAQFFDENMNPLNASEVVFCINGKNYTAKTDENGIAYLTDSKLPVGVYNVTAVNTKTGESAVATATIVKRIIEDRDWTIDFVDGTYYRVRAVGDDGNPEVRGKIVYITANTVKYDCPTDKDGYAYLRINLNPRNYKVTSEYKGYKVSNKVVVKQTLKLVKKNIKVKKSAKKLVIKATLKTSKGKAIAGKKVTFIFKGKHYKAKTNKKGLAKVTIKKKVIKKLKKGKKYKVYARVITNDVIGTVKVK